MANKALVNHLAWNDFLAQFSANSCDYLNKFAAETDNEARIRLCMQEKTLTEKIQSWIACTRDNRYEKNYKKAVDAKTEGNKYFAAKEYESSFRLYTQCIMWAPSKILNAEEKLENILAIGYANRSAAEFYLENYKDCLNDIKMSLDTGYCPENHYKLFARQGQCLLKLGQNVSAIDALEKGLSCLELNDTLPPQRIDSLNREIKGLICNAESKCSVTAKCDQVSEELLSYGENARIASASSALQMNFTPDKGRHIVTTQPLKAGDTVFVEKPFSSVLLPDYYTSHCHSCHSKLTFSIPCENCSQILYCSVQCRSRSGQDSHLLECGHLDLLHAIGIAHLAYRTVLVAKIPFLLENLVHLREIESTESSETWHGDYLSVHSLLTHKEKMKNEDLFCYAATACLLMVLLKTAAFQKSALRPNDETLLKISGLAPEQEIFLGSLFLRHIQQLICNAHAITEVKFGKRNDNTQVEKIEQVRIATAIYPSASLMNHSCEPDIISSFRKNVLIVRVVKDLDVGAEVCNCYGPHFARMTRDERQSSLKEQYFFTCKCEHCINGVEEEDAKHSLRCCTCNANITQPKSSQDPQISCESCGKSEEYQRILQDLSEASTLQSEADELIDLSDLGSANIKLSRCLKLRAGRLNDHHPDLTRARDMMAECCAMQGNYERALHFLKLNAESVQRCYGVNSIEVGHECQKLIDVLVRILREDNQCAPYIRWCYAKEMLEAVEKALTIFLLHYGKETFSVDELQVQKKFAETVLRGMQTAKFE